MTKIDWQPQFTMKNFNQSRPRPRLKLASHFIFIRGCCCCYCYCCWYPFLIRFVFPQFKTCTDSSLSHPLCNGVTIFFLFFHITVLYTIMNKEILAAIYCYGALSPYAGFAHVTERVTLFIYPFFLILVVVPVPVPVPVCLCACV